MNAALALLLLIQGPSDEEKLKRKIEGAVWRGADYLLAKARNGLPNCESEVRRYDELVLYALVHAGVDPSLDAYAKLLDSVVKGPWDRVYTVALRAMALAAIDASKYRPELLMCAQFLVDQQSADGHWGYGTEMKLIRPDEEKPTSGNATKSKIVIKRTKREREKIGDNSNSQYALLGLRACLKAGIEIEPGVFEDSLAAWDRDQKGDGGWGYGRPDAAAGDDAYGSMTAGGVASLIIALEALKKPWKKDPRVAKGLAWLSDNWSVKEHPKYPDPQKWLHYYFYAVERLGDLMGEEKIGNEEWYGPIRDHLIDTQQKDGSWKGTDEMPIADTCFTILFIRRAMKPAPKVSTGK